MGVETYGFKVELVKYFKRNEIVREFSKLGFYQCGRSSGDIYLEKVYDHGYIEVALQYSEYGIKTFIEYNKKYNHAETINMQPPEKKERIFIRIAKPNHEKIIDCLVADFKIFNKEIPLNIYNLQSKEMVDMNNYGNLKEHFRNSREDFMMYYPHLTYPIRCNDVFKSN